MFSKDLSRLESGFFSLSGQFDPVEITQQLEIEPSWTQNLNPVHPIGLVGPYMHPEPWWCLACGHHRGVEDQVESLLNRLQGKADLVSELSRNFKGTVNIVVSPYVNHGQFVLSPQRITDLAKMHVSLHCRFNQWGKRGLTDAD